MGAGSGSGPELEARVAALEALARVSEEIRVGQVLFGFTLSFALFSGALVTTSRILGEYLSSEGRGEVSLSLSLSLIVSLSLSLSPSPSLSLSLTLSPSLSPTLTLTPTLEVANNPNPNP